MIIALLVSTSFFGSAHAHDDSSHQDKDTTSFQLDVAVDAQDKEEALRVQDATEQEKAKERRKDILVYTCFGLALFILLWMRKKAKDRSAHTE